jgi:type IV pilus assembly protein PilA
MAYFYEIRSSDNTLLKRDGGFASQDAAKTAAREDAKKMENMRQSDRPDVGRIMVGQNAEKATRGFSLIELLIVVTIILIISAIAIPNLIKSKIQANETAAVGTLRTLTESAVMYWTSYGGYPHALSDLGPSGGSTNASSAAADLIDSAVASGVKSAYIFTFAVVATDPAGNAASYAITATPLTPGTTGQRSFFTGVPLGQDDRSVIR